jgi:geranylgeranyl reductase family protein
MKARPGAAPARSDVVVIGGGPAGLYAAQVLAGRGLRVSVLEEHERIGEPTHCTGILGAEAFALPGVPRDPILGWPNVARFHSPAGHRLEYAGPQGDVCIIDRGVFDRSLAVAAEAAGAHVSTDARALELDTAADGIVVDAEVSGRYRRLTGTVCLLACGASYRFQRGLGWGMPPVFLGSAQTEVSADVGGPLQIFLRPELTAAGFAWLVPLTRGGEPRAKVGVMTSRAPHRALDRILRDLAADDQVTGEAGPVVARLLPLAPLGRTYGARLLAIGDAAGLVKPTTGGGIYYSLLSARWASDVLATAFARGDFSAASLGGYEEAWRAHLGRELSAGAWFRWLVGRLTPDDLDALTELAITDGVMPIVRRTARFNWHRDLILGTLRHPGVLQIVLRRLAAGFGS